MSEQVQKMRPVVILPKGEMTKADIKKLNDNYFVVVEAKDPSKVRFAEPPPLGYSVQEQAAIKLTRTLFERTGYAYSRANIAEIYVQFVVEGSPIKPIQQISKK